MDTKKLVLSSLAVGAGATGAVMLSDKDKRFQLMQKVRSYRNKIVGDQEELPIEEAAQPDPYDFEKNKMLAEGSTFGVDYYNKVKQEG